MWDNPISQVLLVGELGGFPAHLLMIEIILRDLKLNFVEKKKKEFFDTQT